MNQMLAKKADVDRIYLPCPEGRRSLMNLEKEYKATMIGLQTYMTNKDDVQIQAVLRHQNSKALHSVPKEAEKIPDRSHLQRSWQDSQLEGQMPEAQVQGRLQRRW